MAETVRMAGLGSCPPPDLLPAKTPYPKNKKMAQRLTRIAETAKRAKDCTKYQQIRLTQS